MIGSVNLSSCHVGSQFFNGSVPVLNARNSMRT